LANRIRKVTAQRNSEYELVPNFEMVPNGFEALRNGFDDWTSSIKLEFSPMKISQY
jgi:hypothetical protein